VGDPVFEALKPERDMYWRFHWGIPPTRAFRVEGPRGVPPALAQLAEFKNFELVNGGLIKPSGRVHLATDAKGQNLYLVARNPVRHEGGGGRIHAVTYKTKKDAGGQLFRHEFTQPGPIFTKDRDGAPVIRRAGSGFRVTWRGIEG
jgi:hypothetical protein